MGTEYSISYLPDSECVDEIKGNYLGLTDIYKKTIIINQDAYLEHSENNTDFVRARHSINLTIRHELVHAFFVESGLVLDYCNDETLVDWIATKLPQMAKIMSNINIMLEAK